MEINFLLGRNFPPLSFKKTTLNIAPQIYMIFFNLYKKIFFLASK
jgi:hypothetical protein